MIKYVMIVGKGKGEKRRARESGRERERERERERGRENDVSHGNQMKNIFKHTTYIKSITMGF